MFYEETRTKQDLSYISIKAMIGLKKNNKKTKKKKKKKKKKKNLFYFIRYKKHDSFLYHVADVFRIADDELIYNFLHNFTIHGCREVEMVRWSVSLEDNIRCITLSTAEDLYLVYEFCSEEGRYKLYYLYVIWRRWPVTELKS